MERKVSYVNGIGGILNSIHYEYDSLNHDCGEFVFTYDTSYKSKKKLTESEYSSLLSKAKDFRTTYIDKYTYCDEITKELREKYNKIYLIVYEGGTSYFEYEVHYGKLRNFK